MPSIAKVHMTLGCTGSVRAFPKLHFSRYENLISHICVHTANCLSLNCLLMIWGLWSLTNSFSTNSDTSSESNMQNSPPKSISASPSSEPKSDDHITSTVFSYLSEEKEKAKRKLNFIVHNWAESSSEDGTTRQRDGVEWVTSALQKLIEVTPTISKAIQLGKCREKLDC